MISSDIQFSMQVNKQNMKPLVEMRDVSHEVLL